MEEHQGAAKRDGSMDLGGYLPSPEGRRDHRDRLWERWVRLGKRLELHCEVSAVGGRRGQNAGLAAHAWARRVLSR